MKLFNLINVADKSLSMMLTGIKGEEKLGYDFVNNCWTDPRMVPERIITFGDFKNHKCYPLVRRFTMTDFSTFRASNVKAFKDLTFEQDRVVNIVVDIGLPKKELAREQYKKEAKKINRILKK